MDKNPKKLYKTTMVIWSEFDPRPFDLSTLAREAEMGEAYCSRMRAELKEDFVDDPDWDGTEFFTQPDFTEEE